jgi:hypothetical protein
LRIRHPTLGVREPSPFSFVILTPSSLGDFLDSPYIILGNSISILSDIGAGDDVQSGFLMVRFSSPIGANSINPFPRSPKVSAASLEMCANRDIRLITNFDRLKAQSWRTIQTLNENRQRLKLKPGQLDRILWLTCCTE